jgi:transposase
MLQPQPLILPRVYAGLTPKEHSSGSTRHLGRISKRGDKYLRMLLTHGARASLRAATVALQAGRKIDDLRQWALQVQHRACHNKAACALANKMARICYAVLRDGVPYESDSSEQRKMNRSTFATAH